MIEIPGIAVVKRRLATYAGVYSFPLYVFWGDFIYKIYCILELNSYFRFKY